MGVVGVDSVVVEGWSSCFVVGVVLVVGQGLYWSSAGLAPPLCWLSIAFGIAAAAAAWSIFGIGPPHHRLLPRVGCHTVDLASQGQIYAPKAYILQEPTGQTLEIPDTRHTF